MTRIVVRILVSLLCVPAVAVFCALGGAMVSELRLIDENAAVVAAFSAAPLLGAAAWLAVWSRVIRWTARRWGSTLIIAAAVVVLDAIVAWASNTIFRGGWPDWSFVASMVNILIGLSGWIGCLWVWTETPRERFQRLQHAESGGGMCPVCRYDMRGLTNLRCPECGGRFTLGEVQDAHRRAEAPPDLD